VRASLTRDPSERLLVTVGSAAILALVVGYFVLAVRVPTSASQPVGVAALLVALSVPVVRRTARRAEFPGAVWLLAGGLAVKLAATFVRYWVNNDLYGGYADAASYHEAARILADGIHHGVFTLANTPVAPFPQETQAVAWVLGIAYSFLGSSPLTGYLVFSWIGWLGLVCFYRAFRLAFPDVRSAPCLLLLLLLPSLAYWPSSPGKEALITLSLGLTTLGLTHLFAGRSIGWGLGSLALGISGVVWIRPHIAMLVLVAVAVAMLVWRPGRGTARSRLGRVMILALLIPVLFIGLGRVSEMFGANDEQVTIGSVFDRTREQTTIGDSRFETQPVRSPVDFPVALVSVLTRPFVWEVHNATMLVASAEGVLLVLVLVARPKTLGRLVRVIAREPMGAFCAAYTVCFVIAFSNVGNAGILVRQRTQLLPIVVLMFAATADRIRVPAAAAREPGAADPTRTTRMVAFQP